MRPTLARGDARVRRPALRSGLTALVACVAAACAWASRADAQADFPAGTAWSSLHVPGGTAALLTVTGLEPTRPRTTALLDIIAVIHEVREAVAPATDERRARVLAYLEAVGDLERALVPFPGGTVRLADAGARDARKTFEPLASALGCTLEHERGAFRLRPATGARVQQRRASLAAAGIDVAAAESALNAGGQAVLSLSGDEVPLPLPEAAWRAAVGSGGRYGATLAGALLADRRAALAYYGLCTMDEATRRFVGATPGLLKDIVGSEQAVTIAAYGRSLHVREGRVETPGGAAATSAWESLAGEPVTRPDRFILRVLEKDAGRLALLYDTVAHLDADGQAFALGSWLDAGGRADRFEALYEAVGQALIGWDPRVRPFARSLYDPAHVLMLARPGPGGRPGVLGWRRLWRKAFEGADLPGSAAFDPATLEEDGRLDAAALLQLVLTAGTRTRKEQADTWVFGERLFGQVPRTSLPDVLVALRGHARFGALAGMLERLDITDPAIYAAAFTRADRLGGIGDAARAGTAFGLFQGALVLVERARLSRTLDAAAAGRLIVSLTRLDPSGDGEYLGRVATWIDRDFLPAVGVRVADATEAAILAACLGRRPDRPAASRTLEFEGSVYLVDPSAPDIVRARETREKQGGASLDAVLGFARVVRRVAASADSADLRQAAGTLPAAVQPLLEAGDAAEDSGAVRELREAVAEATEALGRIARPRDISRLDRVTAPLARAVDRQLSRVLVSVAYAFGLADADSTALVAGDPALKHDFGTHEIDPGVRLRIAWAPPEETHDNGHWTVRGSLLSLDVGLGSEILRRVSEDSLPVPPTISDNDRRALVEAVALANTFDYRDSDMSALAGAIRRGRARVAELVAAPGLLPDVAAAAGLDELRAGLLSWTLAAEGARTAAFFSLADLARLGGLKPEALDRADAWGASGASYDGRLRLRYPATQPFASLAGRRTRGLLISLFPDLPLLVAESLDAQHLPAALARSILAVATLELIEGLHLGFEDDWLTLCSELQRIVPSRMDDYLAAVTIGGPLVPVAGKD
jgi:hypothetical protein